MKELYNELIQLLGTAGYSMHASKQNDTRKIEIESLGSNTDTITLEFDFKNDFIEIMFKHDIGIKDDLSIYRNVSKANLKIYDGIIVYTDGKLILRNISEQIKNAETLFQKLSYLQIVAITFFTSIVQTEQRGM